MGIGGSPRRSSTAGLGVVAAIALWSIVVVGCSSDGSSTTRLTPSTPVAPGASSVPATTPGSVTSETFILTSSAFADGESIPLRYACANQGGENASPPLAWSGVPTGTETLVLVVHDPDAPLPGGFTHLVTVMPTDLDSLDDGAGATPDSPMAKWIGPCPPTGEHGYEFTLYAFGPDVTIADGADKAAIDAVADQALASATLTGRFAKQG